MGVHCPVKLGISSMYKVEKFVEAIVDYLPQEGACSGNPGVAISRHRSQLRCPEAITKTIRGVAYLL